MWHARAGRTIWEGCARERCAYALLITRYPSVVQRTYCYVRMSDMASHCFDTSRRPRVGPSPHARHARTEIRAIAHVTQRHRHRVSRTVENGHSRGSLCCRAAGTDTENFMSFLIRGLVGRCLLSGPPEVVRVPGEMTRVTHCNLERPQWDRVNRDLRYSSV